MTSTVSSPPRRSRCQFEQFASELFDILRDAALLEPLAPNAFPLLNALKNIDHQDGADRARRLMILSALLHDEADERRIAEYLLRHRHEIVQGRPVASLISAARFAADMDLRRSASREVPVDTATLVAHRHDAVECLDVPAVGDVVVDFIHGVTGLRLVALAVSHIRDAVAAAMELAERHALNGGVGPSLIAMRPSARPAARLVTQLRAGLPAASARCLARVLVGSDGADLTTAALWWAAVDVPDAADVPALTCSRWARDLQVLDAYCRSVTARTAAA